MASFEYTLDEEIRRKEDVIDQCLLCGKDVDSRHLIREVSINGADGIVHDTCWKISNGIPNRLSPLPDNSHYTKLKMQPWDYILANGLNFFEGNVVKYVTRWRHKNGLDDLRKARVYIDELIRQEEAKEKP